MEGWMDQHCRSDFTESSGNVEMKELTRRERGGKQMCAKLYRNDNWVPHRHCLVSSVCRANDSFVWSWVQSPHWVDHFCSGALFSHARYAPFSAFVLTLPFFDWVKYVYCSTYVRTTQHWSVQYTYTFGFTLFMGHNNMVISWSFFYYGYMLTQ